MLITRRVAGREMWALLTAWGVALSTLRANAEAPHRVALEYEAYAGCPTRERFEREVRARIDGGITWNVPGSTLALSVRVARAETGTDAELEVVRAEGAPSFRRFETERCEDAVVATALVAALAIDPNASVEPGSALAPVTRRDPPRRAPPIQPKPAVTPSEPAGLRSALELGPALAVAIGPAPDALVNAGIEVALETRNEGRALLSPRASVTALVGESGVLGPADESATFTWAVLRWAACPLRLSLGAGVVVRPCAAGGAGVTVTRGREPPVGISETAVRPWVDAGLATSLRYESGTFFVAGSGGVTAAITRDTYVFEDPSVIVYRVPRAVFVVGVGAGWRL
jgi:hypothetical protein